MPSIFLLLLFALIITYSKYEFSKTAKIVRTAWETGDGQKVLQYAEKGKSDIIKLDQLGTPLEMYTTIAFRNKKQYDKAFEEIKKGFEYNPNNSDLLNTYGTIYLMQEDFPPALEFFDKAIKLTPQDPAIKKNIVMAYYFTNNCQKAIEVLNTFKFKRDDKFVRINEACRLKLKGGN